MKSFKHGVVTGLAWPIFIYKIPINRIEKGVANDQQAFAQIARCPVMFLPRRTSNMRQLQGARWLSWYKRWPAKQT